MANWTYGPDELASLSTNELAVVFAEVIRAVQRRRYDIFGDAGTWTPSVPYPCQLSDVQGNVIPWTVSGSPCDWLGKIATYIDELADGGPWRHSNGEWQDDQHWDYMTAFWTPYTESSLHQAAHGENSFTPLSNPPKLKGIRTRLYEAMKCLELLKRLRIFTWIPWYGQEEIDAGSFREIEWYNSVAGADIDDAYNKMDTVGLETGTVRNVFGHLASVYSGPVVWYYISHGYLTLESVWHLQNFDYAPDDAPGHKIDFYEWRNNFWGSLEVSLYGGNVDWPPTLEPSDFPATGGTLQDSAIFEADADGFFLHTMTIKTEALPPSDQPAYFDLRCTTNQVFTFTVAQATVGVLNEGDAGLEEHLLIVTLYYNLKSEYDPTG